MTDAVQYERERMKHGLDIAYEHALRIQCLTLIGKPVAKTVEEIQEFAKLRKPAPYNAIHAIRDCYRKLGLDPGPDNP